MSLTDERPRVLVCDAIAQVGVDIMQEYADVDVKTDLSKEDLLKIIGDYEAVVVRSATKIKADIIEKGAKLKVIGRAGAGLDNIDVVAAQERGIPVVNAPDANTVAVAEHTMALLLALVRQVPRADVGLKQGRWEKKLLMGMGLVGKTLGIIGFGRIGRQVAIRAKAFGMKVVVNQSRPTPELNLELGVEAIDLIDLLQRSDFVTLHVPARPETENLITSKELALMKSTACLINTARGTVIDEKAVLEALESGRLAGAALDVFLEEPATNNALAQHPKVIATPHIAASTQDAQQAAAITIARQIIDVIRGETVENPLSLHVVPTENVFPHENVDPRRVDRLAKRLTSEGVLVNPPIVIENKGRFVVLDGATRTFALKKLEYPHMIVQVINDFEELQLHTWFHAIRKIEAKAISELIQNIPGVNIIESNSSQVLDDMIEYGGLCYVHTVADKVFLVTAETGVNHFDALNKFTTAYIAGNHVTRTLNSDVKSLQEEYRDLSAVVIFPEYTVKQVLQIAQAGRVLPAGITRFVIPGRVLRLNADLEILRSAKPLAAKESWLNQLVVEKLNEGRIRYYEEPVYLLDE